MKLFMIFAVTLIVTLTYSAKLQSNNLDDDRISFLADTTVNPAHQAIDSIPTPDDDYAIEEILPTYDEQELAKNVIYPKEAIDKNITGKVIVNVYIDKTGKPVKTTIAQSVCQLLDDAAVKAVMNIKYTPEIQNNVPVGCWLSIPINFQIPGDGKKDKSLRDNSATSDSSFIKVEKEPTYNERELFENVEYPRIAVKENISGKVIVNVYIDKKGKPVKTKILKSVHQLLDDAAIKAVMKTRFTPAVEHGKATDCWLLIPINFELADSKR